MLVGTVRIVSDGSRHRSIDFYVNAIGPGGQHCYAEVLNGGTILVLDIDSSCVATCLLPKGIIGTTTELSLLHNTNEV
jgi:hypothetical protein